MSNPTVQTSRGRRGQGKVTAGIALDPGRERLVVLFVESGLDVLHVNLATLHNDVNQETIGCTEAFHRLVETSGHGEK